MRISNRFIAVALALTAGAAVVATIYLALTVITLHEAAQVLLELAARSLEES